MIITDRDRDILRHIEEFQFATISQIRDLFFSTQKYGYDIARKRLNLLRREGKLHAIKDFQTNSNIFSLYPLKKVSKHNIIIRDFYTKLISEGIDVNFFKIEFTGFLDGKIRPDAFIKVTVNGWIFFLFLEVITSNNQRDISKYEKLYHSGEFQEQFGLSFPTVIFVDEVIHSNNLKSDHFRVVQIEHDLKGLPIIFLPDAYEA